MIILNVSGPRYGDSGRWSVGCDQSEGRADAPDTGIWFSNTEYIMGLGTVDERRLILIDIEKLMGGSDRLDRSKLTNESSCFWIRRLKGDSNV